MRDLGASWPVCQAVAILFKMRTSVMEDWHYSATTGDRRQQLRARLAFRKLTHAVMYLCK